MQHMVCTSPGTLRKLSVLISPLLSLFSIAKFSQAKILSYSSLDFRCLAYKRHSETTAEKKKRMNEQYIWHAEPVLVKYGKGVNCKFKY